MRPREAIVVGLHPERLDPEGCIGLRVLGKGDKERVIRVRADLLGVLSELHGSAELKAKDSTPLVPSSRGTAYTARGIHKLIAQSTETASLKKTGQFPLASPHPTPPWQQQAAHLPLSYKLRLVTPGWKTSQPYIHWARGLEETTVDSYRTRFVRLTTW